MFNHQRLEVIPYPTFNALATGATVLTTIENGTQRFVPVFFHLEVKTLTGVVGTGATFSVGTNASTYNNILAAQTTGTTLLGSLNGLQQYNILTISTAGSIAPNTAINVNVTIAAIGPTVYTLRPDIIGYYV